MATRAKLVVSSVEASGVTTDATACAGWCDRLAESVNADAEVIAALRAAAGMLATAAGRIDADAAIVATARGMATRYYDETIETRDRIAQIERERELDRAAVRAAIARAEAAEVRRERMHVVPPASAETCPNMARVDALKAACEADGRVRVTSAVVYPNGHTIVEIAWYEPVAYAYGTGRVESGKPRYDFNAWTGGPERKAPRDMVAAVRSIVASMDGASEAVAS